MGQTDGPTMVVISGVGMSVEHPYYGPLFEGLGRYRRVITYDRRGSGASDREVERLGMEAEIEDIAALADQFQLASFDIWGTQEACGIAARYAAENARPGSVESFTGLVRR